MLLLSYQSKKKVVLLSPSTLQTLEYNLSALPNGSAVYESAFPGQFLVAGGPEPVLSNVSVIDDTLGVTSVNVGIRENRFWVAPPGSHAPWSDSEYIKNGRFRHLRTDQFCSLW